MTKLTGITEVRNAFRRLRDTTGRKVHNGLDTAALYLLRESQAIVPVEFGPLRASGQARGKGKGIKRQSRVVYTKAYAMAVHENVNAAHGAAYNAKYADRIANAKTRKQKKKWFARGPNQAAKFLEQPAREKRPGIVAAFHAGADAVT